MLPNEKQSKEYEKWNVTPPTSQPHGTDDERLSAMQELKPNSWRMEGNKLIGQTNWGQLVQYVPTDYLLKGTDAQGLPIFEKIVI